MPNLVMNTGPVIALTAAVGSLKFLKELCSKAVRLSVLSDLNGCFDKMEQKGIWISQALKEQALRTVGSY